MKEKEEARKEYKEAISKGHGAYLMEEQEEQPVGPPFHISYAYNIGCQSYHFWDNILQGIPFI